MLNFVVTDGRTVVATRYFPASQMFPLLCCSHRLFYVSYAGPNCSPASLYYASGSGWENDGADGAAFVMSHRERVPHAYIIASEPLTPDAKDWVVIPPNHIACITPDSDFLLLPIQQQPTT